MRLHGKWFWGGLEIVGVGFILLLGALAYSMWDAGHDHEKVNRLKPKDANFLLEWGKIKDSAKVGNFLYSKVSSRSFTGDHADFYVLEMTEFPEESALPSGIWKSGPLTDPTLQKAVDFAMMWGDERYPGFPERNGLASQRFLFSFPWIYLHGQRVTAAIVMVYDPQTRRLYIVDAKT